MLHKILFAGPVGAGKTSAIRVVSDTPVTQTEARASDDVAKIKDQTTVGMDYGTLSVNPRVTIQLVGTPGQDRFDFMWEILSQGAIGIVILVGDDRTDSISDLRRYLDAFADVIARDGVACSIGVTRTDLFSKINLDAYHQCVHSLGKKYPVFEVDARDAQDVRTILLATIAMLDPRGNSVSS